MRLARRSKEKQKEIFIFNSLLNPIWYIFMLIEFSSLLFFSSSAKIFRNNHYCHEKKKYFLEESIILCARLAFTCLNFVDTMSEQAVKNFRRESESEKNCFSFHLWSQQTIKIYFWSWLFRQTLRSSVDFSLFERCFEWKINLRKVLHPNIPFSNIIKDFRLEI